MRRLVLFGALVAALALAAAAPAAAQTATPQCTVGTTTDDCAPWHDADVALTWSLSEKAFAVSDGCTPPNPFSTTTTVTCTVTWKPQMDPQSYTATVKIDKVAPQATAAAPGRPPDSAGWYNHPVTFAFQGADTQAGADTSGIDGCGTARYAGPDSAAASVSGTCTDRAGNVSAPLSVPLRYDATAPTVTGIAPTRPPDHAGWFNHPVSFSFTGRDGGSGVASCTSGTYSGPDGADARIHGSCHDAAGNSRSATFAIKYDATRPAAPTVHVAPGNHRVDVSWTLPGDANSVVVSRSEQGSDASPVVIYSGSGRSVLDKGLRNQRKYRYTVVDSDAAGNTNSKAIAAVPTASSLRPFPGTVVAGRPLLTWKRVKRATYYNVQLYRGGKKVLSTWPRRASLRVPSSWRFRGKRYRLTAGHYRWYVWPGFGSLAAHDYGKMLGRSSFRMR